MRGLNFLKRVSLMTIVAYKPNESLALFSSVSLLNHLYRIEDIFIEEKLNSERLLNTSS